MSQSDLAVAVLGGGSFGTALANVVGLNGHSVRLWMRDANHAETCQQYRRNSRFFSDLILPDSVAFTSDLSETLRAASLVIVALPSKSVRDIARQIAVDIEPGTIVVSGTKGVEPDTFELMSQVLRDELGVHARIGVLSGPNLATEIADGQITGSVVASPDQELCETVQSIFAGDNFRVYSNSDMLGVELAGTLKNIYAIFAGLAHEAGAGGNTFGMLVTRSLAEMRRFAVAQGASLETFLGLSGVGDLITTCTSPLSRNYQVGQALAKGMTREQAVEHVGQTAEGVNTVEVIWQQAQKLNVSMPLTEGLYRILYEGANWPAVVGELMRREQRHEIG